MPTQVSPFVMSMREGVDKLQRLGGPVEIAIPAAEAPGFFRVHHDQAIAAMALGDHYECDTPAAPATPIDHTKPAILVGRACGSGDVAGGCGAPWETFFVLQGGMCFSYFQG